MHRRADDWEDVGLVAGSRTERRADPEHPLDFFRAREQRGNYAFLLKADELPDLGNLPALSGISVTAESYADRPDELCLVLRDSDQVSIFRALVADILESTRDLARGENAKGARRLVLRLERWQKLLGRRKEKLLSDQANLGLCGELLFLRDRLLPSIGSAAAVSAWRGPYGDEQDFAVHGWILEIKAQLSTADQLLKISSESQLDTESGPIVILHQTFSASATQSGESFSLNDLVGQIRRAIEAQSPSALDLFEAGLINAGYEERPEYSQKYWQPLVATVYEVAEDFPRLVPGTIPNGIRRVRYQILPAACAEFRRDEVWLQFKVLNG
ncbi:MAG: PD-(D/E)XK motif protein [Erythrobacter sp.]